MYNFKEKKLHFNALRNPDAAAFDLELLQKISPSHPNLRTFSRDAKRYGNDILYALLDVVSREEIRAFRRAKQEEALQIAQEETPGSKCDNPLPDEDKVTDNPKVDNTIEKTADTKNTDSVTDGVKDNRQSIEEPSSKANSTEQIEELKQSLEETEERAEEAEEAREEAEEAKEEAEERADAAEAALEEEKKKEPTAVAPAKSKSTKSTRKSTGTTSSTSKSK